MEPELATVPLPAPSLARTQMTEVIVNVICGYVFR
jgi:hypothetical protein